MTDCTLKAKVQKLQQLQTEISNLTDQAEALKDQIKAEMTARETDELRAGAAVIRWQIVKSSRFNSKSFKAEHADLYAKYLQEQEARRFTLLPA